MDKIKIKSLIKMDDSDSAKIKEAIDKSKNINELILITQKNKNAKNHGTVILKL